MLERFAAYLRISMYLLWFVVSLCFVMGIGIVKLLDTYYSSKIEEIVDNFNL